MSVPREQRKRRNPSDDFEVSEGSFDSADDQNIRSIIKIKKNKREIEEAIIMEECTKLENTKSKSIATETPNGIIDDNTIEIFVARETVQRIQQISKDINNSFSVCWCTKSKTKHGFKCDVCVANYRLIKELSITLNNVFSNNYDPDLLTNKTLQENPPDVLKTETSLFPNREILSPHINNNDMNIGDSSLSNQNILNSEARTEAECKTRNANSLTLNLPVTDKLAEQSDVDVVIKKDKIKTQNDTNKPVSKELVNKKTDISTDINEYIKDNRESKNYESSDQNGEILLTNHNININKIKREDGALSNKNVSKSILNIETRTEEECKEVNLPSLNLQITEKVTEHSNVDGNNKKDRMDSKYNASKSTPKELYKRDINTDLNVNKKDNNMSNSEKNKKEEQSSVLIVVNKDYDKNIHEKNTVIIKSLITKRSNKKYTNIMNNESPYTEAFMKFFTLPASLITTNLNEINKKSKKVAKKNRFAPLNNIQVSNASAKIDFEITKIHRYGLLELKVETNAKKGAQTRKLSNKTNQNKNLPSNRDTSMDKNTSNDLVEMKTNSDIVSESNNITLNDEIHFKTDIVNKNNDTAENCSSIKNLSNNCHNTIQSVIRKLSTNSLQNEINTSDEQKTINKDNDKLEHISNDKVQTINDHELRSMIRMMNNKNRRLVNNYLKNKSLFALTLNEVTTTVIDNKIIIKKVIEVGGKNMLINNYWKFLDGIKAEGEHKNVFAATSTNSFAEAGNNSTTKVHKNESKIIDYTNNISGEGTVSNILSDVPQGELSVEKSKDNANEATNDVNEQISLVKLKETKEEKIQETLSEIKSEKICIPESFSVQPYLETNCHQPEIRELNSLKTDKNKSNAKDPIIVDDNKSIIELETRTQNSKSIGVEPDNYETNNNPESSKQKPETQTPSLKGTAKKGKKSEIVPEIKTHNLPESLSVHSNIYQTNNDQKSSGVKPKTVENCSPIRKPLNCDKLQVNNTDIVGSKNNSIDDIYNAEIIGTSSIRFTKITKANSRDKLKHEQKVQSNAPAIDELSNIIEDPGDVLTLTNSIIDAELSTNNVQALGTYCPYCGDIPHPRYKCPAFPTQCDQCQRIGHFPSMCSTPYFINTTKIDNPEFSDKTNKLPIQLNDSYVAGTIVTECEYSLIDSELARALDLKILNDESNISEYSILNNEIEIVGICITKLKCQNKEYTVKFVVLDDLRDDVVLGRDIHLQLDSDSGYIEPVSLFSIIAHDVTPSVGTSKLYSTKEEEFIMKEVCRLFKDGVIETSTSPWKSQVIVTCNSGNKKMQLTADYSETINRYTELDSYNLPNFAEFLDILAKYSYFTLVNLQDCLHQIPIKLDERKYTAFVANGTQYQFTRIPYGVINGVNAFHRTMERIVCSEKLQGVFVLLDIVVVCGMDKSDHDHNLANFKTTAHKYQLTINKGNYSKSSPTLEIYGTTIDKHTITLSRDRKNPLSELPIPSNPFELRRALAMFNNYDGIVPLLSSKISELSDPDITFPLNEKFRGLYDDLRNDLIATSYTPINGKQLIKIEIDNSEDLLSATLTQERLPKSFYSRKIKKTESNLSTHLKEIMCLNEALIVWKQHLTGRHFLIITGNKTVRELFSQSESQRIPNRFVDRLRLEVQFLKYDIIVLSDRQR